MFAIIGIVVVFGCVVGGYLMEHGHLRVLLQPAELITIGGAAIGTILIANPLHILKQIAGGVRGAFGNYSNWELSTDRANAARHLMQSSGIRSNQVTQVRGFSDQHLRKLENPLDPSNRRISLIVQYLGTNADEGVAMKPAAAGEPKPSDEKTSIPPSDNPAKKQ
jgi:hypothetical protein